MQSGLDVRKLQMEKKKRAKQEKMAKKEVKKSVIEIHVILQLVLDKVTSYCFQTERSA